jgi:DHA1 family bicyclomycin/chloramphenicol resistance-like MFS transporter
MIKKTLPVTALAGLGLIVCGLMEFSVWILCSALFVYILTMGMIAPNAAACALANQKKTAGSASALMGTIQFTVSAICSGLVSKLHDGTTLPMTSVMFGCSAFALVLYVLLKRSSAITAATSTAV